MDESSPGIEAREDAIEASEDRADSWAPEQRGGDDDADAQTPALAPPSDSSTSSGASTPASPTLQLSGHADRRGVALGADAGLPGRKASGGKRASPSVSSQDEDESDGPVTASANAQAGVSASDAA